MVSGLQRELGTGDVRREIAEVGKLSGSCGFEGRYHIGTLAMFSNTGRGESGAGRELTCHSWLGCGVWRRVSGWKGLCSTELFMGWSVCGHSLRRRIRHISQSPNPGA